MITKKELLSAGDIAGFVTLCKFSLSSFWNFVMSKPQGGLHHISWLRSSSY